jgi:hypothetical protein
VGPGAPGTVQPPEFSPINQQLKSDMTDEPSTDDTAPTVPRWVISPFDLAEHFLSDTPCTGGVLTTRCGRSLPDAAIHPTPLIRRICSICEAISLIADAAGGFARHQE